MLVFQADKSDNKSKKQTQKIYKNASTRSLVSIKEIRLMSTFPTNHEVVDYGR